MFMAVWFFVKGSAELEKRSTQLPGAYAAISATTVCGMLCFGALLAIEDA